MNLMFLISKSHWIYIYLFQPDLFDPKFIISAMTLVLT